MDCTYEATIEMVDDEWFVSFPQFDGAYGGGKTIEAASRNAAEALRLAIASLLEDGYALPPTIIHEPPQAVFTVEVTSDYINDTKVITKAEAAALLDVTKGRVSQLVKAGLLETVNVNGRSMVTLDSVSARLSDGPTAGRPRIETREAVAG